MRFICLVLAAACAACGKPAAKSPLVAATTTMVTAWVVPQNPLDGATAAGAGDQRMSDQVRLGFRLFTDTPHQAPQYTGGTVSCSNCHLNAGQRDRALPLVGVAGMFPEYNARAARFITLADRIVDCFMRSENAPGASRDGGQAVSDEGAYPTPASKEVIALAAYITWLSRGQAVGANPAWRGHNAIPADKLIPIAKLDAQRGEGVFKERCTSCHGTDGQGVQVGDKKAGPLWGPNSWNDGAGASRVYTLAGIIRYTMPYLDPGGLSDEDAQHVAAFITSQQRPAYPFKDRDYVGGKIPVDAVYYRATRPASPSQ